MAFDLLIQGGQGDLETVRSVGLTPIAPFEHFDDYAAFDDIHDVKQGAFLSKRK